MRARAAIRFVALLVILLVVLYPIAWMVGTSLKSHTEIASNVGLLPKHVTWRNFADGWRGSSSVGFGRFIMNSAVIAIGVVIANVASCLVTA